MSMTFPPIEELVPHAAPMILLDRIVASDNRSITASRSVRSDDRFFMPGQGVPAHIGLEWMAQTCGAFAGLEAKSLGQPVKLGLLLGTRRYASDVAWFPEGNTFEIIALQSYREADMAVFDCSITSNGAVCATARINVYQPEDALHTLFK